MDKTLLSARLYVPWARPCVWHCWVARSPGVEHSGRPNCFPEGTCDGLDGIRSL